MFKKLLQANFFIVLCITSIYGQLEIQNIAQNDELDIQHKVEIKFDDHRVMEQLENKSSVISLPFRGNDVSFNLEEFKWYDGDVSPVPEIHTYRLVSKDKTIQGRMTTGPAGVNVMYLNNAKIERLYYQGYGSDRTYFYETGIDYTNPEEAVRCSTDEEGHFLVTPTNMIDDVKPEGGTVRKRFGNDRRVFRVAISTTAEYYVHNGNSINAVKQQAVQNLMDISFVYESELNTQLIMAGGNPRADYSDVSTDPFCQDCGSRTSQADREVTAKNNSSTYDIGHVFHRGTSDWTSSGGVACLGCVCTGRKASAWSGAGSNTGNSFVSLAAHEFGHQFGARHTFNGGDNANCMDNISSNNAYEIASGVTIMSYNGTCASEENILAFTGEVNSTDYNFFHAASYQDMTDYLETSATLECNIQNWTLDANTEPIVNANPCDVTSFVIPRSTPFFLTGSATDADGDPITYAWEQFDEDGAGTSTIAFRGAQAAASKIAPIFRCFPPTTSPTRHFPQISTQLLGFNQDPFEVLPTTSRTLNFRLVVRDNNPGGTAVDWEEISVIVTNGSFKVNAPNGNEVYEAGEEIRVEWDVTGLENICDNAQVRLSADGGISYPYILEANADFGKGFADIVIPPGFSSTEQARIRIQCGDYDCFSFYDNSNNDFTIMSDCMTPNHSICGDEPLEVDFRDAQLNLGLGVAKGNAIFDYDSRISNTGETMNAAVFTNGSMSGCTELNTGNAFDTIRITPTVSGTYTFSFSDVNSGNNNVGAYSIFTADNFSRQTPCTSFVASNSFRSGGGFQPSRVIVADLEACTEYLFASFITSTNALNIRLANIQGPGNILRASSEGAGTQTAYVAVNNNTSLITRVNSDSDFIDLEPGTYRIYSIISETGVNSSGWIGSSLNSVLYSGDCINVSGNFKPIEISSNCAIANLELLSQSACDGFDNTYSQTFSFEVLLGPTSGNVTVSSPSFVGTSEMTFPFTAGINELTLDNLRADGRPVDLNFSFSADAGCVVTEYDAFLAPENCCPITLDLGNQRKCEGEMATLFAGNDGDTYEWFKDDDPLSETGNTITPTEPGVYRVIVTDANGCSKSDQAEVAFDSPPMVTIETTVDELELCIGDQTRMDVTVSNQDSLVWYRDGIVVEEFIDRSEPVIEETGLYRIEVFNGGCMRSDEIQATFLPGTPFEIGEDRDACEGDVIILEASDPDLSYEWINRLGGNGIIGTSNTLEVTDGGNFVAIGTNEFGCTASDTVDIDFFEVFDIDLGPDVEFCESAGFLSITSFNSQGLPVEWYLDDVLVPELTTARLDIFESGTWEARIPITETCILSDEIEVNIIEAPEVDLGPDMAFCEGEDISVFLFAGPNREYLYNWVIERPDGTFEDLATGIAGSRTVTEPGRYTAVVTDLDFPTCETEANVLIEVVSSPSISFDQPNISFCPGFPETIEANTESEAITWYLDGDLLSSASGSIITVADAGVYTAVIAEDQQCEVEASFTVTHLDSPDLELPEERVACQGTDVELFAGPDGTGISYVWLLGGTPITGATSGTYLAVEEGEYEVIATNSTPMPCIARDTTEVRYIDAPFITLPSAPLTGCTGDELEINASSNVNDVVWYRDNVLISQTGRTIVVSESGVYRAVVGEGQTCEDSAEITVTLDDQPVPELGADQSECEGTTITLDSGLDPSLEYTWMNGTTTLQETTSSIQVTEAGTYTVTARNSAGCEGTDQVMVNIIAAPFVTETMVDWAFCAGDVGTISVTSNISTVTWFLDGNPIDNQDALDLEVSEAGEYSAVVGLGQACEDETEIMNVCLLYTSPSPRDGLLSRMPSSA